MDSGKSNSKSRELSLGNPTAAEIRLFAKEVVSVFFGFVQLAGG